MIINADFRDPEHGLVRLDDRSVDHAILDAPYSEHTHNNIVGWKGRESLVFGHLTPEVRKAACEQIARVIRRWALVFSDEEGAGAWRDDLIAAGLEYIRTGWWVRTNGTPQRTGDRPAVPGEVIVIAHQTNRRRKPMRKRWNGGGKAARWTGPRARTAELHRTTKPLWLMEALICDFTDPGETIVDLFAGSGSTLVAAAARGRKAIGWEIDPDAAAIAEARVRDTGLPADRMPTDQLLIMDKEVLLGT